MKILKLWLPYAPFASALPQPPSPPVVCRPLNTPNTAGNAPHNTALETMGKEGLSELYLVAKLVWLAALASSPMPRTLVSQQRRRAAIFGNPISFNPMAQIHKKLDDLIQSGRTVPLTRRLSCMCSFHYNGEYAWYYSTGNKPLQRTKEISA